MKGLAHCKRSESLQEVRITAELFLRFSLRPSVLLSLPLQVACILHFMQLPIEDAFLDDMEAGRGPRAGPVPVAVPAAVSGAGGGGRLQPGQPPPPSTAVAARQVAASRQAAVAAQTAQNGVTLVNNILDEDLVPFVEHANPVMAQLAFLSATMGPRVAAAAAQKAFEVREFSGKGEQVVGRRR